MPTEYSAREALFRGREQRILLLGRKGRAGAAQLDAGPVGTYRRFAENQRYLASDIPRLPRGQTEMTELEILARELRRHYQLMDAERSHSRQ